MKPLFPILLVLVHTVVACHKNVENDQTPRPEVAVKETNPLLAEWNTPFGVPPFDLIENKHFLPAMEKAIATHRAQIDAIVSNAEPPTFENTVAALDRAGELLSRVRYVFYGKLGAHTNDELDEIAKVISPLLSEHMDNILLDEKLFARVKTVHDNKDRYDLNIEQQTLLEESYQDFVRGGANLDGAGQTSLRAINEELSVATLQFGQNILKEDNTFHLALSDKADLAGLPDRVVDGARKAAEELGLTGKWVFTLQKPSLLPFLTHSERRELREQMFKAYISRGGNGDESDNEELIRQIVDLRTRKAKLLGHETYAQFALARRMAGNPERVYELLDKLWKPAVAVAQEEATDLQKLIDEEAGDFKLEPWDWWYYSEKVRKERFDLDDSELRPFFSLENVQRGAFEVANRLYGLTFVERTDIPKYHPDVKTWEVKDKDGAHVGLFYTDFFPRASKRGGAWCGAFRESYKDAGKKVTPVVTNVGNFSKPTDDKPALLSFEEVTTLFHEFGHALHSLLNDTTYHGTRDAVRVDFVELPSQIMENWAAQPEVLKMYARHWKTGEPIPDELIRKIEKSGTFNQGFANVEYLAASYLDMFWHNLRISGEIDVDVIEKTALQEIGLIPEVVSRYQSTNFRHIFSGSYYAAGYYSYIWAAVLDADAFEAFKQDGLFDRKTADAFREHILSKGGSEDQMVLYRRFRGADPKIEPLLKRRGLLAGSQGAQDTAVSEFKQKHERIFEATADDGASAFDPLDVTRLEKLGTAEACAYLLELSRDKRLGLLDQVSALLAARELFQQALSEEQRRQLTDAMVATVLWELPDLKGSKGQARKEYARFVLDICGIEGLDSVGLTTAEVQYGEKVERWKPYLGTRYYSPGAFIYGIARDFLEPIASAPETLPKVASWLRSDLTIARLFGVAGLRYLGTPEALTPLETLADDKTDVSSFAGERLTLGQVAQAALKARELAPEFLEFQAQLDKEDARLHPFGPPDQGRKLHDRMMGDMLVSAPRLEQKYRALLTEMKEKHAESLKKLATVRRKYEHAVGIICSRTLAEYPADSAERAQEDFVATCSARCSETAQSKLTSAKLDIFGIDDDDYHQAVRTAVRKEEISGRYLVKGKARAYVYAAAQAALQDDSLGKELEQVKKWSLDDAALGPAVAKIVAAGLELAQEKYSKDGAGKGLSAKELQTYREQMEKPEDFAVGALLLLTHKPSWFRSDFLVGGKPSPSLFEDRPGTRFDWPARLASDAGLAAFVRAEHHDIWYILQDIAVLGPAKARKRWNVTDEIWAMHMKLADEVSQLVEDSLAQAVSDGALPADLVPVLKNNYPLFEIAADFVAGRLEDARSEGGTQEN